MSLTIVIHCQRVTGRLRKWSACVDYNSSIHIYYMSLHLKGITNQDCMSTYAKKQPFPTNVLHWQCVANKAPWLCCRRSVTIQSSKFSWMKFAMLVLVTEDDNVSTEEQPLHFPAECCLCSCLLVQVSEWVRFLSSCPPAVSPARLSHSTI